MTRYEKENPMQENVAMNPRNWGDDTPMKTSGVRTALDSLERECDRFGKIAAVLNERLGFVLNPDTPHATGEKDGPSPAASSELAGVIESHVERLQQIGGSLDRTIARIDV